MTSHFEVEIFPQLQKYHLLVLEVLEKQRNVLLYGQINAINCDKYHKRVHQVHRNHFQNVRKRLVPKSA